MAKILLNNLLGGVGKLLRILESIDSKKGEPQEKNIESTRVSGIQLADLINQRLRRRFEKANPHVLNENDLLPFSFLEKGRDAGKSVCCLVRRISKPEDLDKLIEAANSEPILRATVLKWYKIDPITEPGKFKTNATTVDLPYASGFLVGGDYLITNRHVVDDKNLLPEFRAVFNYEAKFRRQEGDPELLAGLDKYEFDPTFLVTSLNTDLDYVLLKLKPLDGKFKGVNLAKNLAGEIAPEVSTQTLADSALKDNLEPEFVDIIQTKNFISADPIHMIQHPGGRPKEIVVFNNRLVNFYENFLEYDTDAEPGSSGSPLFNTDWQVVGIHQAALLDEKSDEVKVKAYLGIRLDRILADLKAQSSGDSELRDFLDKYVDRTTPPTQLQVFILAGRPRRSLLGEQNAKLEKKAMEHLQKSIIEEMKRSDPGVRVVPITVAQTNESDERAAIKQTIQDINTLRNSGQQGELAIELLINSSDTRNSRPPSIKLYYSAANDRAKKLAESLQTVLQKDNPSFDISTLPDSYTSTRGLRFCRDVNLPAVVIFVGDLANASNRAYIEKIQQDPATRSVLATSLTKGILNALKVLEN
ncbi:MAG TPA: trypsin-like peptidase domain-containing protein [Nostoc sp.]|uniref:trypsin-like peptidase domain-containing protein n=1 Tax=Nostoc sp. TaxID=1180 RepID=UPI002D35E8A0|nr:trypsin-like peptidase domain-containing protein [Nostoc sp.]HYX13875.1 trypsin-like peptidase domain-containing protein [Nostoc sp.]